MRSAKLVVPTLIAKWVQTIHLSANASRTMSAIRCKDVDVNVKHLETALSLRNANVSNACPSVGRMVIDFLFSFNDWQLIIYRVDQLEDLSLFLQLAVRMQIVRLETTGPSVHALLISLGMDLLDVIQNVQNMTIVHKTR